MLCSNMQILHAFGTMQSFWPCDGLSAKAGCCRETACSSACEETPSSKERITHLAPAVRTAAWQAVNYD